MFSSEQKRQKMLESLQTQLVEAKPLSNKKFQEPE
jgi:hypothetical protein